MQTYNDGLKWAAQWVLDSLKGETNERVIEFGNNIAMTLRAAEPPTGENEFPAPQVNDDKRKSE